MQTDTTYQSYLSAMQNAQVPQDMKTSNKTSVQKFEAFLAQLGTATDQTQTASTTQSEAISNDLSKLLQDLHDKGAAQFLADLNQEKIDKEVEKYKQKLIGEMGDSPEAMQKIDKLVEEYRKQLMEALKDKMEAEQKAKNERNPTPFEILLQA
jgi:proline dehydrogenase